MLTDELVRSWFPRGLTDHVSGFATRAEQDFERFDLTGPTAVFLLATIAHETMALTRLEENCSYRAERLCAVWPTRFRSLQAATLYAQNPEKLADRVYASRMGNGDEKSGDGFRFRGRGYLQLTGRAIYREVGLAAGLDLEGQPDLVTDARFAMRVAAAYWRSQGLARLDDFAAVSRRVNGGTTGMADRLRWYDRVATDLRQVPAATA